MGVRPVLSAREKDVRRELDVDVLIGCYSQISIGG